MNDLVVDNFAGAGGASTGIEAALGRPIDLAVNHDALAIAIHSLNHPRTKHLTEDIWHVDPKEATGGRPVGLAWFSPDCKHFSRAKGGKPVDKKIRGLAWVVTHWARDVRPKVIILENVLEFQDWGPLGKDHRPLKRKKGDTFRRWKSRLRNLGYRIDHRPLIAADYGTPTIRKRFFMVARLDGKEIRWPSQTHWPRKKAPEGVQTWQPASQCIDWSLPCFSIFGRKRPLAPNTMRRIAQGLKRFVIDNPEPFLVTCNHAGPEFRGQGLNEPMSTLTASRDARGIVVPALIQTGYGEREGQKPRSLDLDAPLGTVVAGGNKHALAEAYLFQYYSQSKGRDLKEPVPGQTANMHDYLLMAFLNKHFGGVVGQKMEAPLGTVTTKDHHSLTSAFLTEFRGTCKDGRDARDPLPTLTAQGKHIAEVRAFLIKYFGTAVGQDIQDPAHTITAKARLGLVMVQGKPYKIVDIGLRMLKPHELLRAQFGRFAKDYQLLGTQEQRVAAIGNSVCPELAEALVKANVKGDA